MIKKERKVAEFVYGIYNRPAWVHENDIVVRDGGCYLDIVMFGSYHIGLYYDPSDRFNDFAKADDGGAYGRADLLYAAAIMNNRDEIFEILSSDNEF